MIVFPPQAPGGPPEELIMFVVAAAAITAILIFRPLVKAWARRLGGADASRLDELDQRLSDLEHLGDGDGQALRGELNELQERLDFTERLLARADIPKVAPAEQTDETTGFHSGERG
jgi:hypothetical protein